MAANGTVAEAVPDIGAEPSTAATVAALRRCLIGLAALGATGTAVELVLLRHWNSGLELVPFGFVAVLAIAIGLVAIRPTTGRLAIARALAIAVAASGAIGAFVHTRANYEAAPLDFRYTDSWPTTAEPLRWLLAATDTVGPAPTLAPAALTFVALVLLAATIGATGAIDDPA